MTHAAKPLPRRTAIAAAGFALLLLAGCSTGHIGESWQCPLAEGGSCDSVAAADPAVPAPAAAGATALAEPLWRVRTSETNTLADPSCAADCGAGFDPFGWLVRLFGGVGDGREGSGPGPAARLPGSGAGTGSPDPGAGPAGAAASEPEPVAGDAAPEAPVPPAASKQDDRSPEPEAALFPADPGPAQDGPEAADLRTGEVVARIWIAPFVDGNGVYREASHVRVVLEPAGWRLR